MNIMRKERMVNSSVNAALARDVGKEPSWRNMQIGFTVVAAASRNSNLRRKRRQKKTRLNIVERTNTFRRCLQLPLTGTP
jgi:hypothetical protein